MAGLLGKLAGSIREAKSRAKADADQRAAAGNALTPDLLLNGVNAGDVWRTTLGLAKGEKPRPITDDDLAQFRQSARALGQRFKGGITPRQVIDMSLAIDRKRARQEIHTAVPGSTVTLRDGVRAAALQVRFLTSVGPGSKVSRHFVTVEFGGYSVAIASGADGARVAAKTMRMVGIRFDCDCEHHRYRRRYIATLGNYNAGRAENAFPKITNPGLAGVACKHVLRVMAEVEGGNVDGFLARAIEKGRGNAEGRATIRNSQKEVDKQAERQSKRPMGHSVSSGDADFDRSRAALRKASRATKTAAPKRVAGAAKRIAALSQMAEASPEAKKMLFGLVSQLGLSPAEAAALLMKGK